MCRITAPEPEFARGERVGTFISGQRFEGEVLDRHLWDDSWWYTIDYRNYLDESKWARMTPEEED